ALRPGLAVPRAAAGRLLPSENDAVHALPHPARPGTGHRAGDERRGGRGAAAAEGAPRVLRSPRRAARRAGRAAADGRATRLSRAVPPGWARRALRERGPHAGLSSALAGRSLGERGVRAPLRVAASRAELGAAGARPRAPDRLPAPRVVRAAVRAAAAGDRAPVR